MSDADEMLAERLLLAVLGVLIIRVAVSLWRVAASVETVLGALPTVLTTALGVQMLVLAVVGYDLERHGRSIGYATVGTLTGMTLIAAAVTSEAWIPQINTDAAAFLAHGLALLRQGANPMAADMTPALSSVASEFWTRRVDGSRVVSWSYPAGMIATYIPQWLVLGQTAAGYRLTTISMTGLLGIAGVRSMPHRFAIVVPIAMLGIENLWRTAAGGVLDAIWAFPLLIGVVSWARGDWWLAGIFVGIACGVKQLIWPMLPFLLIWVIRTSDSPRAFARRAGKLNIGGVVGFLVVAQNAVFLWWSPGAWWSSVMTPLGAGGAPLQSVGLGLAVVEQFSPATVAPSTWTLLLGGALIVASIAYYHFFEYQHVRWSAWILPMALWVFHSRSLINYFTWLSVIAVVVIAASVGQLRGQEVQRPCAE
jgi:hypothetical protein